MSHSRIFGINFNWEKNPDIQYMDMDTFINQGFVGHYADYVAEFKSIEELRDSYQWLRDWAKSWAEATETNGAFTISEPTKVYDENEESETFIAYMTVTFEGLKDFIRKRFAAIKAFTDTTLESISPLTNDIDIDVHLSKLGELVCGDPCGFYFYDYDDEAWFTDFEFVVYLFNHMRYLSLSELKLRIDGAMDYHF